MTRTVATILVITGIAAVLVAIWNYYAIQANLLRNSTTFAIDDIQVTSISETSVILNVDLRITNSSDIAINCSGFNLNAFILDSTGQKQPVGGVTSTTPFTVVAKQGTNPGVTPIQGVQISFDPSIVVGIGIADILSAALVKTSMSAYIQGNLYVQSGIFNINIPVNVDYTKQL